MEEPMGPSFLVSMLPLIIVSIPFTIGNYYIAKALRRSVSTWVILSLIPLINYIFFIYVAYVVVLQVIRRLEQIASALNEADVQRLPGSGPHTAE
jgi:hypothetical protein